MVVGQPDQGRSPQGGAAHEIAAEAVEAKIRGAAKAGTISGRFAEDLAEQAVTRGVITGRLEGGRHFAK